MRGNFDFPARGGSINLLYVRFLASFGISHSQNTKNRAFLTLGLFGLQPQRALDFSGDLGGKILGVTFLGVMEAVLCAKLVRNAKAYGVKIV